MWQTNCIPLLRIDYRDSQAKNAYIEKKLNTVYIHFLDVGDRISWIYGK